MVTQRATPELARCMIMIIHDRGTAQRTQVRGKLSRSDHELELAIEAQPAQLLRRTRSDALARCG